MTTAPHDWLTLHRIRFGTPIDGTGAPLAGPARAAAWRVYPSSPVGENGMRTNVSAIWGGLAIYHDRADAEADLKEMTALPWMADVAERWSAVAIPYRHHGSVIWLAEMRDSSAVRTASADPGGRLVVLTSAGYDAIDAKTLPRNRRFLANVDKVVADYRGLDGIIAADVFTGGPVDGHDGATMTIWRDDAAMQTAAYRPGTHRTQMDTHEASAMFDRSSWTRARIVASSGSCDGTDPAA